MSNQVLIINTARKTGVPMTLSEAKVTIGDINSQLLIETAKQQSDWAWSDVMVGFNEVGYDVSHNESERIKHRLFIKKLKSLIRNTYKINVTDL